MYWSRFQLINSVPAVALWSKILLPVSVFQGLACQMERGNTSEEYLMASYCNLTKILTRYPAHIHTSKHTRCSRFSSKLLIAFSCLTARGCTIHHSNVTACYRCTFTTAPPYLVSCLFVCVTDFSDRFRWYLPATRPSAENLLLQSYP